VHFTPTDSGVFRFYDEENWFVHEMLVITAARSPHRFLVKDGHDELCIRVTIVNAEAIVAVPDEDDAIQPAVKVSFVHSLSMSSELLDWVQKANTYGGVQELVFPIHTCHSILSLLVRRSLELPPSARHFGSDQFAFLRRLSNRA